MQERKTWINHPAFTTVNKEIKDKLRDLAFDFHLAVQKGDQAEAVRLIDDAKDLKWSHFPYQIIPGGKSGHSV